MILCGGTCRIINIYVCMFVLNINGIAQSGPAGTNGRKEWIQSLCQWV